MNCAHCGRLAHRCGCAAHDSDIKRFLARGGREYKPKHTDKRGTWAVPPQIKRRERAKLRANYKKWHEKLAADYGGRCANCGTDESLAIDHVLPIARGGKSKFDNLQLLCGVCNRLKGKLWVDCRGEAVTRPSKSQFCASPIARNNPNLENDPDPS